MQKFYLVAWTGGYDQPQYAAFTDAVRAENTAVKWAGMADEVCTIDLLKLEDVGAGHVAVDRIAFGDTDE